MGQKVHPVGFRLGINKDYQSKWFTNSKNYPIFLAQDKFLRNFLFEKYQLAGISGIEIERKSTQIQLTIKTSNPRVILQKDQTSLETLRADLEKKLERYTVKHIFSQKKYEFYKKSYLENPPQISIFVTKIQNPNADVHAIGQFLVNQLEERVPFRKAVRQAIQRAEKQKVQGIKIQISGRLNGAEIARSEWVRKGRVPLQTLRANIDYSYTTAKTIYGLLGIKIWVFHSANETN